MNGVANALRAIGESRIFFGHRSVGSNILAGLRALAQEVRAPLRIVEVTGEPLPGGPGLYHTHIGQNGDPASKCEAFERLLIEQPSQYDIAAMKFCYVDLRTTPPLSMDALLERYAMTIDRVRAARPDVQLMHITIPLTARPSGAKAALKRFLGVTVADDGDNILRAAFNRALRERYEGEPLFDLAAVESARPDGRRSGFTHDGDFIPTLADVYTHDGGHLTAAAQRHVAAAFARTLADALASRFGGVGTR